MNRKSIAVSKLNLCNLRLAYTITITGFIIMTIVSMVQLIQGAGEYFEKSYLLSSGNMLYLLIPCCSIIIPSVNFVKTMHIGGRKKDFLKGALITYSIFSAIISIANLLFFISVDKVWSNTFQVANLAVGFGWTGNGIIIAFFQQFVFLLLIAIFIHTLAAIQGSRLRWPINIFVGLSFTALISIPILRRALFIFFRLITVWQNAWVQIFFSLFVIIMLYIVNQMLLNKKTIE